MADPVPAPQPDHGPWTGMLASLQGAYAELAQVRVDLERQAAELKDALDLSRQVLESMTESFFLMDRNGRVIQTNQPARALLNCTEAELVGRSLAEICGTAEIPATPWELLESARDDARPRIEATIYRDGGVAVPISISCSPFRDGRGRIIGMLAVARDITARKRAEAALAHQALHDPLTDLPNRALIYDRLQQAILAARRTGGSTALLVIDLNQFKEVNDTLGHYAGDVLLQQVGQRMLGAVRESDTVARLGGDEFGVLIAEGGVAGASQAAGRLLAVLEAPCLLDEYSITVGASIGIAVSPDHGDDAETLFRRADVAMYVAKRSGGGYAFYSPEQDQDKLSRLEMVRDLRQAIPRDELVLYYQPQIDLATGEMVGVEALVRWRHPERGLVLPDTFIPLAEQMGLIDHLSQWVVEEALRQSESWLQMGLDLTVSVNLSVRNLQDSGLPAIIAGLLDRHRVPPASLKLEITESMLMADATRALEVLTCLRSIGVQTSIDDFGTGYSSLAYLKRLPVDQIKIDKSFVRDMATDENDFVIVRSIIDLGHNLGLAVVAEGVEDQTAMDHLSALGCDVVQGYFVSRPLPAADMLARMVVSRWPVRARTDIRVA